MTTPRASPTNTSVVQCASSPTRVVTRPMPATHTASRCRLGKHDAAEASAPTCTAWPEGNASHRLPESGTTPVAAHRKAIGARLVEDRLQQMRQTRCNQCCEQNVVRHLALPAWLATRVNPPGSSRRYQEMLVGSPRQRLSGFFCRTGRMRRNRICNRNVLRSGEP